MRSFRAVGDEPVFIEHGDGPFVFDADSNRYVDLVCGWGSCLHGHAYPSVVEAVIKAADKGLGFGACCEAESRLAEIIIGAIPSIERVRFVNSGTEAVMSAIRLARAATGRTKILKFAGGYHGHVDSLLVSAGSGAATLGRPDSAGVPESIASTTIVAPYNDLAEVEAAVTSYGKELAGILVEPIAGNMGFVPPVQGFLAGLRSLCDRCGALLIFDEVMTGFRVAWGGYQTLNQSPSPRAGAPCEHFAGPGAGAARAGALNPNPSPNPSVGAPNAIDSRPDITVLGKVIGGGMPVAAYGGTAALMSNVSPLGPMYQAGTLSGNPVAMAAGIAALSACKEQTYNRLRQISRALTEGLQMKARESGFELQTGSCGGLWGLAFSPRPIRNFDDAKSCDHSRYAQFFRAMMDRGVFLPPSSFEALFVSAAHESAVEQVIAAADKSFRSLRR